jgi:DNA repair ATPase RecN
LENNVPTLDERLTRILQGLMDWNGEVEQAEELLATNAELLATLTDTQTRTKQTQALVEKVVAAYQAFLTQVQAQQTLIKQEMGRLNRQNNLVKTYLQQEDVAGFVEFDY